MNLKKAKNYIYNGTVESIKIREIETGQEGIAFKYDHNKAIENSYYEINKLINYSYGNDYEITDTLVVGNTYLSSVIYFIHQANIHFCKFYTYGISDTKFAKTTDIENIDLNGHTKQIEKVIQPKDSEGITFAINFHYFIPDGSADNICSSEELSDGDYFIVFNNKRPFSYDSERFFKRFEIIDTDMGILNAIHINIENLDYDKFKKIMNVLEENNIQYKVAEKYLHTDRYLRFINRYEREKDE